MRVSKINLEVVYLAKNMNIFKKVLFNQYTLQSLQHLRPSKEYWFTVAPTLRNTY